MTSINVYLHFYSTNTNNDNITVPHSCLLANDEVESLYFQIIESTLLLIYEKTGLDLQPKRGEWDGQATIDVNQNIKIRIECKNVLDNFMQKDYKRIMFYPRKIVCGYLLSRIVVNGSEFFCLEDFESFLKFVIDNDFIDSPDSARNFQKGNLFYQSQYDRLVAKYPELACK